MIDLEGYVPLARHFQRATPQVVPGRLSIFRNLGRHPRSRPKPRRRKPLEAILESFSWVNARDFMPRVSSGRIKSIFSSSETFPSIFLPFFSRSAPPLSHFSSINPSYGSHTNAIGADFRVDCALLSRFPVPPCAHNAYHHRPPKLEQPTSHFPMAQSNYLCLCQSRRRPL